MIKHEDAPQGEDSGVDMRLPMARSANRLFRRLKGRNMHIDMGEHGEVNIDHIRLRDAVEEGKLKAYIRQEATDPKVIVPTIVALGVVATGMHHLKHRKAK